jgi:hypothetical protein
LRLPKLNKGIVRGAGLWYDDASSGEMESQMSFSAKFLRDGSTAYRNNDSGVRYIIASCGADCGLYREGRLIFTGPRAACVNAIESEGKRHA